MCFSWKSNKESGGGRFALVEVEGFIGRKKIQICKINDAGYAKFILNTFVCFHYFWYVKILSFSLVFCAGVSIALDWFPSHPVFLSWHSSSPCCPSWSLWSGSTLPTLLPMAAASWTERTCCLAPLAAPHSMESLTITPSWPTRWDLLTFYTTFGLCVKCVCSMMCWRCIVSDSYSRVTWVIHQHHRRLFLPPHHLWTDRRWSMDLPPQKSWPAKLPPWVSNQEDLNFLMSLFFPLYLT